MGVLIAQLSTCHREKFRCSRSINNYRAIMFYIQKDFDTKIDIHYYRFGIYNKDPGFCKQKAIKVYTATQGTISQRFLNLNLITIFNTYYQRRAFCYRDRHVNKFDLLKCSKRRVIDQISIGQNLNHFYIVKKRSKKKTNTRIFSSLGTHRSMAFNIECFLADEFENFSPVAIPCSHNTQKKVIYDILKTKHHIQHCLHLFLFIIVGVAMVRLPLKMNQHYM